MLSGLEKSVRYYFYPRINNSLCLIGSLAPLKTKLLMKAKLRIPSYVPLTKGTLKNGIDIFLLHTHLVLKATLSVLGYRHSVRVSIVIKHSGQKHLGVERVCFSLYFHISVHH